MKWFFWKMACAILLKVPKLRSSEECVRWCNQDKRQLFMCSNSDSSLIGILPVLVLNDSTLTMLGTRQSALVGAAGG